MTDADKRAFLEDEGWTPLPDYDLRLWRDKRNTKLGLSVGYEVAEAYALASRRKASRERARLIRAGWYCLGQGVWQNLSLLDKYYTHKGAIAYLDRMEGKE